MSPVISDMLARFARLPRNAAEVWQGGMVRIPAWVENGPGGKPYRPWGAFWVSLRSGLVHEKSESDGGSPKPALVLEALLEFGLQREMAGCRPGRIEVADEELAAYLRQSLANANVAVSVVAELAALKEILAHLAEHMSGKPLPPDALRGAGVTVDHMRAFADAARDFHRAAPWRHLSDEDLVHVESPVAPGLRHLTVLGGAGQTFGLGFYEKPEEFEQLFTSPDPEDYFEQQGKWAVLYGPITDLPYGDVDLWETHGLSVAGDDAYPVAVWFGPGQEIRRPDARTLADMEGLLLALAASREDEIDRGRWSKEVRTGGGPRTVTLCLPELLEPLDAPPRARPGRMPDRRVMERTMVEIERFMTDSDFRNADKANAAIRQRFLDRPMDAMPSTASTPLERAQELMYRAFDSRGRRRIQLARKALEISPDCADAYVLLAEEAPTADASLDLHRQGVAAAERALGSETVRDAVGQYWGIVSTRPYMRARLGLAQCLHEMGRTDEAIGHYQELLRLNPNDNQGVRDILLPLYLAAGRDPEAGDLLGRYTDEASAVWKYGWALWTFRREGDGPASRNRLLDAIKTNRHVPGYLTGKTRMPEVMPVSYSFGSPEEAALCAEELAEAWRATPGAERWLLTSGPKRKTGAPKRRQRSR